MELYCNRGGLAARRLENFIAIQLLYCRRRLENVVFQYTEIVLQEKDGLEKNFVLQYNSLFCRLGG